MYQGQKVHLFRPSLGFLAEAPPYPLVNILGSISFPRQEFERAFMF
jgi:hypothetical protein